MTGVVEGHSNRLEEVEKEHSIRTRELREQNLELAARVETLKDALDGERGQGKGKSCEPTGLANYWSPHISPAVNVFLLHSLRLN